MHSNLAPESAEAFDDPSSGLPCALEVPTITGSADTQDDSEEPNSKNEAEWEKNWEEWEKSLPFEGTKPVLKKIRIEFGQKLPHYMETLFRGNVVDRDFANNLDAEFMCVVLVFQCIHTCAYVLLALDLMCIVTCSGLNFVEMPAICAKFARGATTVIVTLNPVIFTYGEMHRALKCFAASKLFWLTLIQVILYCELFLLAHFEIAKAAWSTQSLCLRTHFGFAVQISWIVVLCYTLASSISENPGRYKALVHIFNGAGQVNGWFIAQLKPKPQLGGSTCSTERSSLRIVRWMVFSFFFGLPLVFGVVVTAVLTFELPIE
mmetsp:Transcript_4948/g.20236  ORF Transcript_4948/g.20236 Transcript_4948/m.20236 type:complete len:320 (-) Transcript_4948:196-1155(-)